MPLDGDRHGRKFVKQFLKDSSVEGKEILTSLPRHIGFFVIVSNEFENVVIRELRNDVYVSRPSYYIIYRSNFFSSQNDKDSIT